MTSQGERSHSHHFAHAANFGRGFAGAFIFGLPLLMTMEMWWIGFTLEPIKLVQFSLVDLVVLVILSRVSGYDPSRGILEDVLDALAAFGMGAIASAATLWLFAEIGGGTDPGVAAGKIIIQSVPASFGAMIADKLFGEVEDKPGEHARRRQSYAGQLFLMIAGALFLSFTMSPTEEIGLISYRMSPWHALTMMLATVGLMHMLVYAAGFTDRRDLQTGSQLSVLVRFTVVAYAIAALTSGYILWTFGRTDGLSWPVIAQMIVVLAFPAGVGAAIARLVV
jgi:putative integral membrane protein (TIGR02587 family)